MSNDIISYQNSSYSQSNKRGIFSQKLGDFFQWIIKIGFGTNLIGFLIARSTVLGGLTPFGLSYYCALFGSSTNMFILLLSVNIGILTTGITIIQMKYIISTTIISISSIVSPVKKSINLALRGFITIFAIGNIVIFYRGFLLYDFILNFFESSLVFIFILLFKNGIKYFGITEKLKKPSTEQLISITTMSILAIIGISRFTILGLQIKNVLIITLIMIVSLNNGASVGTTIGLISGLIISISGGLNPVIIGAYGFCGLMGGVFKDIGKLGVIIGFLLANAIITIYINGSTQVIININDIILAAIAVFLIPSAFINKICDLYICPSIPFKARREETEKVKDIMAQKLSDFADSFFEFANTFNTITENNVNMNKEDKFTIFEEVAERVCKDCTYNTNCWGKKSIDTYEIMHDILDKLEHKGHITRFDVPQHFRGKCIRLDNFINTTNYMYDLYNCNLLWKNKIIESRAIISQQMNAVSKVISGFIHELDEEVIFEEFIERRIQKELLRFEFPVIEVLAIKNKNRRYEVTISYNSLDDKNYTVNIVEIVSEIVGREMVRKDIKQNLENNTCIIKLCEPKNYRIITGIATTSKNDHEVSGDSYSAIELEEGKFILAISDGMGSGQKALSQSSTVLNLLERFLKSGVSKNLSIKLINSILLLNSTQDTFTTIDLSIIDLFSADAEFIKNGAAATFIKRKNKVEVLTSTSLPVGILKNIDMEVTKRKLTDDDVIVMVSDGVVDSKKNAVDKENWIISELLNSDIANPKLFADYLISRAKENYMGCENDDMTVIVARIAEKIC